MDADSSYTNQDPDLKVQPVTPPTQEAIYGPREEYISGLRGLASWLEQHPEITVLPDSTLSAYPYGDDDSKESAAKIMRAMGSCEKRASDHGLFYLVKKFGGIELRYIYDRDTVCVRKVVGKKFVEEKIIPPQDGRIIAAHEEDIVEWDCQPVLKPAPSRNHAPGHDPVTDMLIAQGKISDF